MVLEKNVWAVGYIKPSHNWAQCIQTTILIFSPDPRKTMNWPVAPMTCLKPITGERGEWDTDVFWYVSSEELSSTDTWCSVLFSEVGFEIYHCSCCSSQRFFQAFIHLESTCVLQPVHTSNLLFSWLDHVSLSPDSDGVIQPVKLKRCTAVAAHTLKHTHAGKQQPLKDLN